MRQLSIFFFLAIPQAITASGFITPDFKNIEAFELIKKKAVSSSTMSAVSLPGPYELLKADLVSQTRTTSIVASLTTKASSSTKLLPSMQTVPPPTDTTILLAHADEPSDSQNTAKARIAVAITIVTLLIIILVALIFFEHGKRVAACPQDSKLIKGFDQGERGMGGSNSVRDENCRLMTGSKAMELDGLSVSSVVCASYKASSVERSATEQEEAGKKKVLSMQSIYELG